MSIHWNSKSKEADQLVLRSDVPGIQAYVVLNLVALKAKIGELEELLPLLASGGCVYAWSYFEKVGQLAAREPDDSRSDTEATDACPAVAGEIKM